MKKIGITLVLGFFIACLFGAPVLSALKEHDDYSIYENRTLASFPQFSAELLFNGHYTRAWENYLTDRVIGRNTMIAAYTDIQMNVLKKPVVNDVVLAGDTLLPFNAYKSYSPSDIRERARAMASELSALDAHIRENGGKFLYVAIPEQRSALAQSYPGYLNSDAAQLECISSEFFSALQENNISYLDMKAKFGDNIDEYYSKLDHHFTYKGAHFTYLKVTEALGIEPARVDILELSNPYYGSRNRKLYNTFPTDEKFMIGQPQEYIPFTRTDNGEQVSSTLFAYSQDTSVPVTYAAYMGGDVAETVLDTGRNTYPDILIFGDSFTNPMESLLYLSANRLYSIDLRHYTEKTLFEYISQAKPDIVLCVRDDTNYLESSGNGTFR